MENQLEDEKDAGVLGYVEVLENCKEETGNYLAQVMNTLEDLRTLQDNYHYVSNKTNSLHNSCQQLIEEQV